MNVDQLEPIDIPEIIDVLVAEYLDALDHGSAPSRADWLGQHPEYALELGRFLDDLERLSPSRSTCRGDETQTLAGMRPEARTPDSNTIVWNAGTDAGASRVAAGSLPFNGTFGDYELLETIARGGMGVVFKARQRRLGRVVALKMILAGQLADHHHVERFQAEARAAAHLDHPGIVPVYEVGEQEGLHYFTMAYIEGKNLADRLRDGPLPPKEAARLVRDLAAAIAYAHEQGIVHRDLKPANVLIDAHGQPKLTDFGLAKQIQNASDMTGTGQILGTPSYMSPEQARGGTATVGPASDVYGLGALLFALLTGRPPFQGSSPIDTIQHVLSEETPKPRSLNPSVPRDLETICLKCLEKAPDKRYDGAAHLKDDLERFLDDQPILARPVGVIERTYRWYRRRPVIGTMAGMLAALLIAIPVLLAFFLVEAEARVQAEANGRDNEKKARQKVEQAHEKTKRAERERTRQLFQAYVNEAAARRSSPRVGRGFDSLGRIAAARDLADELKLPPEEYTRLRSEALGAMAQVDLRNTNTGPGWLLTQEPFTFRYMEGKDSYLTWDKPDGLQVRRKSDGQVLNRIPVEHTRSAQNQVQLSPDNRFVSSQVNDKLVVWQVDGAKPNELARHDGVWLAHFAPDRPELIIYKQTRDIVVQPLDGKGEARTVRIAEILKEPKANNYQFAMRPGPRGLLAVAAIKKVQLVDLNAGKMAAAFPVPGRIGDIAWSPAGDTVAVSSDDLDLILYQPANKSLRSVKCSVGGPERICFDASGELLLVCNAWTNYCNLVQVALANVTLRFHLTELTNGSLVHNTAWWQPTQDIPHRVIPLTIEDGIPHHAHSAVHPGGRLLATPVSRGIGLADLGTGKRIGHLSGSQTLYCCFDADGNLYAQRAGPDGRLHPHRWSVRVKGDTYEIGAPERIDFPCGAGLAVSADGRWIAGGGSASASVLDRRSGKSITLGRQIDVRFVIFHPKEPWVASFGFSSEGFRIWDATTGKQLHAAGKGGGGHGRFTPDGQYLIAYGYDQPGLSVWSMPDCKFVRHLDPLGAFAVSPDSEYVATAEYNGKMRLTRIADGALIARFDAPGEEYIADATFSPDGRYLIGLNVDRNRQHIWDLWRLRRRLGEMKLDWDKKPAPEAPVARVPIRLEIASQVVRDVKPQPK